MKKQSRAPSSQIAVLGLISALGLSACSELKKVDEMKDNTSEMNNTTKTLGNEMGTTNEQMKELLKISKDNLAPTTGQVAKTSNEILDAGRQGSASELRRASMDKITKVMSLQTRLAEATLYVSSYEHQLLGDVGRDVEPEQRLLFYQQTLSEFMTRLDELAPKHGRVWPEAKPNRNEHSEENKAAAFNAMAFAISKNNRKQFADPAFGKPMSIYDLIIHALKMKPEIDAGRVVLPAGPHYIKEVLSRPDRIRQLLQTRYNMFGLALLSMTTDFADYGMPGQALKLAMKIDVDFSEARLGVAGLALIREELLEPAVQTTQDMLAIGLRPEFTTLNRFILSRLNIRPTTQAAGLNGNDQAALELWQTYLNP